MAIQDHYLPEDLTQLNEELLKLHNTSIKTIKEAQEGNFENMGEHQWQINKSIKVMLALHKKKLKREEHNALHAVYNSRR